MLAFEVELTAREEPWLLRVRSVDYFVNPVIPEVYDALVLRSFTLADGEVNGIGGPAAKSDSPSFCLSAICIDLD